MHSDSALEPSRAFRLPWSVCTAA